MNTIQQHQNQWVRSEDGWLAGVCQGFGQQFGVNAGAVRLLWLFSVLFFGVGVFLYFLCAFLMPVEGRESSVNQPKILGVCLRLAQRFEVDVVPVRIVAVFALLGSFGMVLFLYFVLHFLLPNLSQLEQ